MSWPCRGVLIHVQESWGDTWGLAAACFVEKKYVLLKAYLCLGTYRRASKTRPGEAKAIKRKVAHAASSGAVVQATKYKNLQASILSAKIIHAQRKIHQGVECHAQVISEGYILNTKKKHRLQYPHFAKALQRSAPKAALLQAIDHHKVFFSKAATITAQRPGNDRLTKSQPGLLKFWFAQTEDKTPGN